MVMELAFRVKVKTVDDKQNCSLLNNLSSLELKSQYMSPTGEIIFQLLGHSSQNLGNTTAFYFHCGWTNENYNENQTI